VRLAVVAMSKDDNPKAVVMATPAGEDAPTLAVKVALTPTAAVSVRAEAAALERLASLDPTLLGDTVPRRIALHDTAAGTLLVTTVSRGRPLAVDYHRWHHTSRRRSVEADFRAADAWLASLRAVAVPAAAEPSYADELEARWPDDEVGAAAAQVCRQARERIGELDGAHVAHGDFWCGNILRSGPQVSGVVDWEHTRFGTSPLWDRVRFALAYTLYLDRHTRVGASVHGHPGLTAGAWGEPVRYLLQGRGWYTECVGAFIAATAVGDDPLQGTWRDAVLVGLGQVARGSDQADFARAHARLLAEVGS
jgi:Phosphotransferase enzyme family